MVLCEQVNKLVPIPSRVEKAQHRGLFFSKISLAVSVELVNHLILPFLIQCELFHFYDKHDIWHFLSATSLFLNFMMLLTIDDDLHLKPREQIPVF